MLHKVCGCKIVYSNRNSVTVWWSVVLGDWGNTEHVGGQTDFRKCMGLAMYWLIHVPTLISELTYHWVGIGEEYNPRRFHVFQNGFILPRWGKASCVAVREATRTYKIEWTVQDCENIAGYVCEIPLGTLAY